MTVSDPLKYWHRALYINGLKVESLTMVGLLAEQVPQIARERLINWRAMVEDDLPDYLCVSLDGWHGARKVAVQLSDKSLALGVSRGVRTKLQDVGLRVVRMLCGRAKRIR